MSADSPDSTGASTTGNRKIIGATQLRLAIGICFAIAALVGQTFSGAFVQELIADAAILSIFALSLDFLARSGLVSFGHAGFFGLGAYAFGGAAVLLELPAWSGMLLAIAGGVIAAMRWHRLPWLPPRRRAPAIIAFVLGVAWFCLMVGFAVYVGTLIPRTPAG